MASSMMFCSLKWFLGLFFLSSSTSQVSHSVFSNPNISLNYEQYRTAFHFQPHQFWMNDPNAPMYYNGIYHLFYQYNPHSASWAANISWGHSVSTDLINWTELDVALYPSKSFDINGCWSGSATILPNNTPVIFYTSIDNRGRQVQTTAYPKNLSDPYLREWVKPDYNPVIQPFDGLDVTLFRDPSTAWVGPDGQWRIVVGTVISNTGRALMYKSPDFVKWTLVQEPLYYTNGSGMWECVDFFPIGEGKYLLKVSFFDSFSDHYTIGMYDKKRDVFVGNDESSSDYRMWKRIDYGSFYASKTFYDDAKKRRILWAWSNESDSAADDMAKGWAGIQTVPRVLSLDPDGNTLLQWPIQELESLRMNEVNMHDIELVKGSLVEIEGVTGAQADVEIEFELGSLNAAEHIDGNWVMDSPKLCREKGSYVNGGIGPFGLLLLASDDLQEHTAVFFDVFKGENGFVVLMCTDQRRSSSREALSKLGSGGFVDMNMKSDGKISLRTLIDHSVVESFGNQGRTCITSRVYPTSRLNATRLYAFNNGSETVKISKLTAWGMAQAKIN